MTKSKHNIIFHLLTIIMLLIQFDILLPQIKKDTIKDYKHSEINAKVKYGFYGGINFPLSPEEITRIPKIYDKSSESLMNGLDGLGYKSTYIMGIQAKFKFYPDFWIGGNFAYSSWLSKNSCGYDSIPKVNSENFLSLFTFGTNSFYFFTNNLYAGAGVDINLFYVKVKENESKRNIIDFTNQYTRIGFCLILGADISIIKNISLDVSLKTQFTNLLTKPDNNPETTQSETIISPQDSNVEAQIILLQLIFGIIISSN